MLKQRQSLLTQQTQPLVTDTQLSTVEVIKQSPAVQQPEKKQRLISLDVLRGLTVIGMLVVDDLMEGPWWIQHPQWNGFTFADLVFPSFVFIMGVAVPLSLSKNKPFKLRNLLRIIGLFGIGLILNLFDAKFNFTQFRVLGILQRIALCYGGLCFVHVITNYGQKSYRFIGLLIAIACGAIYVTFMTTFVNQQIGCPHQKNLTPFCNFGSYWDRKIIGKDHMIYYPNEPQGLFTTLTAFLNGFAGYWFSLIMFQHKNDTKLIVKLWIIIGLLCALISLPLTWLMPLNKKLWSISYTFLTIGISGVSLALITIALDLVGKKNEKYQKIIPIITAPFIWMGRNPLAIFASRQFLDDLLNSYIVINDTTAWQHLYHYLFKTWISIDWLSSIMFSVFLLLFFILEAYVLFRNNIFIRL